MDKEQQIIKARLQRLTERIKKANWPNCDAEYMSQLAEERVNELQQSGVNCVDRFVQKLLNTNGKEEYLDILMEGRFAIILARNKFSDIEIEYCHQGPDLKTRWNRKTVYFEVTRKRPSEDDEWASLRGDGVYSVKRAKCEDVIGKIQSKLRQLKGSETNIIVLWSNTPGWSNSILGEAHQYIKQEICHDRNRYTNLSAILFTTGGVDGATLKQFYLFENDKASKLLGSRFTKKLNSLHEQDLKQLQRDQKELEAAFKRMQVKGN
jgi:hypothetical protein